MPDALKRVSLIGGPLSLASMPLTGGKIAPTVGSLQAQSWIRIGKLRSTIYAISWRPGLVIDASKPPEQPVEFESGSLFGCMPRAEESFDIFAAAGDSDQYLPAARVQRTSAALNGFGGAVMAKLQSLRRFANCIALRYYKRST